MFKKLFILSCAIIFLPLSAISFSEDNLSMLEYSKYGKNYPHESIGERLTRLETDYFGMAQAGDIDSRLYNLSKINENIYNGVSLNNNYNQEEKKPFRNFFNNLKSAFSDNGYITGFTPPINTTTTSGYNDLYDTYNPYSQYNHYAPYNSYPYERTLPHRNMNNINRFVNNRHLERRNIVHQPYHRRYNSPYIRPYSNRTTYYSPPNVETHSSVHILRD